MIPLSALEAVSQKSVESQLLQRQHPPVGSQDTDLSQVLSPRSLDYFVPFFVCSLKSFAEKVISDNFEYNSPSSHLLCRNYVSRKNVTVQSEKPKQLDHSDRCLFLFVIGAYNYLVNVASE